MKMAESIPKFIEKLKSEHQLKGKTAERILDSIAENLTQIESAKLKMEADALFEHSSLSGTYLIPYGFAKNRFGELKEHPGIGIIVKAETSIRASIRQLRISVERTEGKKEKVSTLGKLMKSK